MHVINVYNNNELCTEISFTIPSEPIFIKNFTTNLFLKAFGNNLHPTWEDLEEFLESRCIPRTRTNIKELLDFMGLPEYDPWLIIPKTKGRMAEDHQWLEIQYDDDYIQQRDKGIE